VDSEPSAERPSDGTFEADPETEGMLLETARSRARMRFLFDNALSPVLATRSRERRR
jgi:hypothetical protein